MYERMLDKTAKPTMAEMAQYTGNVETLFYSLNEWLSQSFGTVMQIDFPYGNKYGWGVAHRIKRSLICYIFAEKDAFTVMLRLTDKVIAKAEGRVLAYTQTYLDHKYPCGDGGWIHYRVTGADSDKDVRTLLTLKLNK